MSTGRPPTRDHGSQGHQGLAVSLRREPGRRVPEPSTRAFLVERTPPALTSCANGAVALLDTLDRAFYVTGYSGGNVQKVTLGFSAPLVGSYAVQLTARGGAFDGPVLGSTFATARIQSTAAVAPTEFAFPGAGLKVAAGSTVVFTLTQLDGLAVALTFDASSQGACGSVVETEGTTPPLSTVRRTGMRVAIAGDAATASGDLDQSGARDIFDIVTLAGSIVGNVASGVAPFTAAGYLADLDRDGKVDVFDLILLQGLVVGNVPQVPV